MALPKKDCVSGVCTVLASLVEARANSALLQIKQDPQIAPFLRANPLLDGVLMQAIFDGRIPEERRNGEVFHVIRTAEASSRIGRALLEGERPSISGNIYGELEPIVTLLMKDSEELESTKVFAEDKTFHIYLKHMAKVAYRLLAQEENFNDPIFRRALLKHICLEFELLRKLGVSSFIIKNFGHKHSVFHFEQLINEAQKNFGKKLAKTAAWFVWIGKYPSVHEAKAAYDKVHEEAIMTFGSDDSTKDVVGTATRFVWEGRRVSVQEAKETYDAHLKDALRIFGNDPSAEGVVKSAAGFVWKGTYPSITGAKAAYDKIHKKAIGVFGSNESTKGVVGTATNLVWGRRNYKSIQDAKDAYDKILKEAIGVFNASKPPNEIMKSAVALVWKGKYASVQDAKDAYDKFLEEAALTFRRENGANSAKGTAAYLVWTGACSSITHAKKTYDAFLQQAGEVFGSDALAETVKDSAAFLVWKGKYASMQGAKDAYDKSLSEATKVFGSNRSTKKLVRSAAGFVWRGYYASVQDAKNEYDELLLQAANVFGDDASAEAVKRTAAFLVWEKRKFKSVQEAKIAFDSILAETEKIFGKDGQGKEISEKAAHALFCREYGSISEIKDNHDKKAEKKLKSLKFRLGEIQCPDLMGLDVIGCFWALEPIISKVGYAFRFSLGFEDARSEATLMALILLNRGERNTSSLVDSILLHVDSEATKMNGHNYSSVPFNEEILYQMKN